MARSTRTGLKGWAWIFGTGCLVVVGCSQSADRGVSRTPDDGENVRGGSRNPTCLEGSSAGEVQAPRLWKHLEGQTSWFASPLVVDLDGDGRRELISAYYDVYIFGSDGELLDRIVSSGDRVYAPHAVVDLEGDGIKEIVFGAGNQVWAYEWRNGKTQAKPGWPALADSLPDDGKSPEVRGLAVGDLDGDSRSEVVATTTETAETASGGAQVFVFDHAGELFQPVDGASSAWPRYNAKSGPGNDADRNGLGHSGYGCYGLNVGLGNVDDDADTEIVVTYDNHHLQVFDPDGVALEASSYFTQRGEFEGERFTYGQFIRWADPDVEARHYHDHVGAWPDIAETEWLQWTQSPPSVADLDRDGKAEIIGVPNVEMHEPYETQAWAVMVLEGSYGTEDRAARRKPGWEDLPRGKGVLNVDGWYPPTGIPAPVVVNLQGDEELEIVVSLNDYRMHAFGADGTSLWYYDYSDGQSISFASEPTVADLNQDGSPEVLFTTYGDPDVNTSGRLVILGADGSELSVTPLENPGHNGNGNGAPAAPAVGDLDGDGTLEVFVQTFDHGMDAFKIDGSADNCILWGTARGGALRQGRPDP